jgi:hypothetical protein
MFYETDGYCHSLIEVLLSVNLMNYIRILVFSSLSFLLFASTLHPEVLALIAKQGTRQINTCRELQDAANKMKWSTETTFQGFENLRVETNAYQYASKGEDRLCQLGYITTISPMGKEICKGYLYTDVTVKPTRIIWGSAYMSTNSNSPRYDHSSFCRYIN